MSGGRRTGPILAIVLLSYLMIVVDISIVITALPKMHESLGLSTEALSWVQNAYLLAFGGLLLLGARAGHVLGRRRVFMIGVGRERRLRARRGAAGRRRRAGRRSAPTRALSSRARATRASSGAR